MTKEDKILELLVELTTQLTAQGVRTDAKFDALDARFDKLDEKVDKLEEKVDNLKERVGEHEIASEARFNKIENRLKKIGSDVSDLKRVTEKVRTNSNALIEWTESVGDLDEVDFPLRSIKEMRQHRNSIYQRRNLPIPKPPRIPKKRG